MTECDRKQWWEEQGFFLDEKTNSWMHKTWFVCVSRGSPMVLSLLTATNVVVELCPEKPSDITTVLRMIELRYKHERPAA